MKVTKNISIIRIICTFLSLIILTIPWYQLGLEFPNLIADGKIIINSKYLVVGFIFLLSILLKIFEIQRNAKKSKELKLIKALENSSDQIFIQGLLIILAYNGFISVVIPVIILSKTILVETMKRVSADNGKMTEKSRLGLCETIIMYLGILLLLFYNLPFELWNFYLADALILLATVFSVLNGCIYYFRAKNLLLK